MTKRAACEVVDLTETSPTTVSRKRKDRPWSSAAAAPVRPLSVPPLLDDDDNDQDDNQTAAAAAPPPIDGERNAKPEARESVIHILEDEEEEKESRGSPIQPLEGKRAPDEIGQEACKLRLQQALWATAAAPCATSRAVARMPLESLHESPIAAAAAATSDEALALRLQEQWNEQEAARKAQEEKLMKESVTGKALELVKGVLQMQQELAQDFPPVAGMLNSVARDDLVFLAEATLQERLCMKADGKPVTMDVGYHFTRVDNMRHIRTGGLLTLQDRNARGIAAKFNGASMGDGIYTANDTMYAGGGRFGDTGLLVARLKGVESSQEDAPHDSYIRKNIVVLRQSSQCLPLLEFDRSMLKDPAQAKGIWAAHVKLQLLLDQCLNGSDHAIAPTLRRPKTFLLDQSTQQAAKLQKRIAKQAAQQRAQIAAKQTAQIQDRVSQHLATTAQLQQQAQMSNHAKTQQQAQMTDQMAQQLKQEAAQIEQIAYQMTKQLMQQGAPIEQIANLVAKQVLQQMPQQAVQQRAKRAQQRSQTRDQQRKQMEQPVRVCQHRNHQQADFVGTLPQSLASILSSPQLPGSGFYAVNTLPSGTQGSQSHATQKAAQLSTVEHIVNYTAPDSLEIGQSDDMFAASVPSQHYGTNCSICLCAMNADGRQEVTCLAKCGHAFHFDCLSQALKKHRQCPNCRAVLGTPRGKMPSGSMRVTLDSQKTCSGHSPGTICIHYSIQGGIQKEYHGNPGVRFGSRKCLAYLPDCAQGRDLLKRLMYAFGHGLTFAVGTSLSTRQTNTVTWASVHHKTAINGGAHGFPDPNYFTNCHSELGLLGVPAAKDL